MVDIPASELDELTKFLTVERWIRGKSPKTRYTYLRNMVKFRRATDLNPDQFIAWAKKVDSVEVQDQIEKMAESLPGSGDRFNFKTDMRSFLRHNGYNSLPKATSGYTLQEW